MNNLTELKAICENIEKEIWDTYVDENGKADPIIDGIVDIEKFQATSPKILWILKEPYDDEEDGFASGGGWHFSKDFLAKDDFYTRMGRSRATWHPIIYVSYGIINNFVKYGSMDYIRDDLTMADVIKQIAVINVKKLPGFTRTYDFSPIADAYQKNRTLLHKQIEQYNPDIVIGASTMRLFYDELGIKQDDIVKNGSIDYSIKNNRLYIDAYHPGQTQITRDKYVDDIIITTENYWTKNKINGSH